MMLPRRSLIGAGLMTTGLALPAIIQNRPAAAQPASPGTRPLLTIGVAEVPPTLEPARELSNVGTRVTYSIFDTLIRRDFLGSPDGGGSTLKPHLATSWERESPSSLVLQLRPGVRFHNGDLLTAEDVVYTFTSQRMFGPDALMREARSYFATLAGVEAVGENAVRFTTRVPDVLLEQRLASWCAWIVNKRAYEELGFEGFSRAPIGTGPYKVRELQTDQRITLDAFDDYWMGRPTARGVVFRQIPELAARVAALQAGDVDLITNVPPDQIGALRRAEGIVVRDVVLANSHVLTFDERGPGMGDKRVRQALGLALDRQLLVDTLWDGKAVVPPGHNYPEYGPMFLEGRSLRHDPAGARRLLREAGYGGQEIIYRTMPNYYTNALRAAQVAIEMWREVGVNAKLQVVENFAQMRAAGQQIGNNSNSTRLPDPLGALWISWGPSSYFQVSGAFRSTETFNAAGRALEAETDPAKRKALFKTMLDAWEDAAPGTVLYQPAEFYAMRRNIDWRPYTFYFMDLRPDNLRFT
ncbi:ABC transporter substrate-binding protein [Roseomonas frigidaquae]|uniref:ABC transporter substrate-binding protein n=1 Tax=Falsiroseomonas frigidaquae TaxID=487318 RepID=A0ABX1EYN2_9PROT|nr:ABC transporter substrate-binding protein [Falsiroseomonas frigidaquae]NKE45192.1 ABC transporter substrate-binding protein [Falsiroseomonas frigidaquae]